MSDKVKEIIKIILIILIFAAEVVFGIKINDVNNDLKETKQEIEAVREENMQLRQTVTEMIVKEKE